MCVVGRNNIFRSIVSSSQLIRISYGCIMDNQIYIEGCQDWLIVSPTPIAEGVSEGLRASYKMLLFQFLGGKPIVCVCVDAPGSFGDRTRPIYPIVYPGTIIVPVSEWDSVSIVDEAILINSVFVSTLLGKSAYEISMTDLLSVFEVLTDAEKLVDFEDTYGLIIGGVRCGM